MKCRRQLISGMKVRGENRNVWKGSSITSNSWHARTYVSGKTVSGVLTRATNGSLRFKAKGKNASLLSK